MGGEQVPPSDGAPDWLTTDAALCAMAQSSDIAQITFLHQIELPHTNFERVYFVKHKTKAFCRLKLTSVNGTKV